MSSIGNRCSTLTIHSLAIVGKIWIYWSKKCFTERQIMKFITMFVFGFIAFIILKAAHAAREAALI